MTDDETAKNLWALANATTGFAVVQGVGFALALGHSELSKLQDGENGPRYFISVIALVFSIAYSAAVLRMGHVGAKLDSAHQGIWREVTWGRVAIIWLVYLLTVLGLFAKTVLQAA